MNLRHGGDFFNLSRALVLINEFWRKRYQIKPKNLFFKLISDFDQRFHRNSSQNGVESLRLVFEKIHFETCKKIVIYTDSQKHESTLLHTYVLNEFLTADHSSTTKYFWNTPLLVAHIFFGGTVSLWKMFEKGKIAVFEGKWRRFRILLKV